MNKKSFFAGIAAALLLVALLATAAGFADEVKPGSEGDPIVSKSYVDSKTDWQVVFVEEGNSVICGAGTELILRSGKALAIDNGFDGVSDLTSAADLLSGEKIIQNHLLLIPRDDGRGIKCTSGCYVMVRGSFVVNEAAE